MMAPNQSQLLFQGRNKIMTPKVPRNFPFCRKTGSWQCPMPGAKPKVGSAEGTANFRFAAK